MLHPDMMRGVPVTPKDIADTPLIAWRLGLSEDGRCTNLVPFIATKSTMWIGSLKFEWCPRFLVPTSFLRLGVISFGTRGTCVQV
jgi:hypothetical protein